jgi:hypothetical protein
MNTTPTTNPVIERIRKALAIAADQSGKPEGDVAARIARNLMEAHALTMADLDVADRQARDPLCQEILDFKARSMWRRDLVWALCRHCTVKAVFIRGSTIMKLYGHAHDIAVLRYLYEIVLRQLLKAADQNLEDNRDDVGDSLSLKLRMRNEFMRGAVIGVGEKLVQIRDDATRNAKVDAAAQKAGFTSTSTAMVMVSRANAVDLFFKQNTGRLGTSRSGGGHASAAGIRAGRSVSLNAGIGQSGGARQLGGG